LDNGNIRLQPVALQLHDDVQALVQELGKRVRGIHRNRCEHRINGLLEKLREVFPLVLRHIRVGVETEALLFEAGHDLLPPAAVLVVDHLARALADKRQDLAGREAVRPDLGRVRLPLLLEAGDPDLEKLIQIRADDAEEFQAFENRVGLVECLV